MCRPFSTCASTICATNSDREVSHFKAKISRVYLKNSTVKLDTHTTTKYDTSKHILSVGSYNTTLVVEAFFSAVVSPVYGKYLYNHFV